MVVPVFVAGAGGRETGQETDAAPDDEPWLNRFA